VDFPALAGSKKNARRRKAWILFEDESGISQQPAVRRTWSPRGETPVLIHSFNWKRMSAAAALAYRWDGKRCGLLFQLPAGSYDTESLIGFLQELKRHLRGKKVILVWDQLPGHKSRQMRKYLQTQRNWLRVEWLPGYAPDLNPVETMWGNLKGQELANRCAEDLGEAVTALENGMARVGRSDQLCFAFLDHAGLSF
jgi:transposase